MFSDHNAVRLEINYKEKKEQQLKTQDIWSLNSGSIKKSKRKKKKKKP